MAPGAHRSRIRILLIFSFLKFHEFYDFFRLVKIRNFANHRCLTCFDVLECNVHFIMHLFVQRITVKCKPLSRH